MSFITSEDRKYLDEKNIIYYEHIENSTKTLIIANWSLPPNKFDQSAVHLLIVIPPGYPDIKLEMFYVHPPINLISTKRPAFRADINYSLKGMKWQRWSRHNPIWRPGIDGIHTFLKRINNAFQEA